VHRDPGGCGFFPVRDFIDATIAEKPIFSATRTGIGGFACNTPPAAPIRWRGPASGFERGISPVGSNQALELFNQPVDLVE
jgi:hypothetical protein